MHKETEDTQSNATWFKSDQPEIFFNGSAASQNARVQVEEALNVLGKFRTGAKRTLFFFKWSQYIGYIQISEDTFQDENLLLCISGLSVMIQHPLQNHIHTRYSWKRESQWARSFHQFHCATSHWVNLTTSLIWQMLLSLHLQNQSTHGSAMDQIWNRY